MRQNIAALLIATASAVNVDKANHNSAYDAPDASYYGSSSGNGRSHGFGPISSGHFGHGPVNNHVVVTNTDTRPTGDYASSFLSDFDYLKGSHHTSVPDFSKVTLPQSLQLGQARFLNFPLVVSKTRNYRFYALDK